MLRSLVALAAAAALASPAVAQTVRFQTSVGSFDMLLNPTRNDGLQPLVDNLVANVGAGVYRNVVVNRADPGFVLQLGGFFSESIDVGSIPLGGFDPVPAFDSVIVDADGDLIPDADLGQLSNVRGTVSLALSAPGGVTDPNSGSASFFVNVGDNAALDAQGFVPFAAVSDMTVVDQIMGLNQVDLTSAVGLPGNLAYSNVPLDSEGNLVVIETATVLSDDPSVFVGPLRTAFGLDQLPLTGGSASGPTAVVQPGFVEPSPIVSAPAAGAVGVPEPTGALLVAAALVAATRRR